MKLDRLIAVRNTKTVYRDGDKCIKVFIDGYSKAQIMREALHQAQIEEMGVRVPELFEVTTIDGKWAIVSEYIKGKTVSQLMTDNGAKREYYLELFVDLQLALNEKSAPLLDDLKNKLRQEIRLAEVNVPTCYELLRRLNEMPERRQGVCHGDFNPTNILITDDGLPYILDWSHLAYGDPAADAASTYLLLQCKADKTTAEDYLSLFCHETQIPLNQIEGWIPIVAAALSTRCKEKDRIFLLSQIHVGE